MTSNLAPSSSIVRNCYNCGQPEHLSRFYPLPDRRLVGSFTANVNTSTAIVPAQRNIVVTYPATGVNYVNFGYGYGGGLKPRVETLETTVTELKAYRDAVVEQERIKTEEEKIIKKEKEDEERRAREKKKTEELHLKINVNIAEQLKPVRELLETKAVKGRECDEVVKLRLEIENLKMVQKKNIGGCSTSESDFDQYKRELEEERGRADHRFVVMEEEIARLKKANEEVLNSAETWRLETLRPGNKRGCVAVTPPPIPTTRTRARVTPKHSLPVDRQKVQEMMAHQEHHEQEIERLKEWRHCKLNGRHEAEQEVDRLKDKLVLF
ncbi:hypothetical protein CBR_g19206 [Chara braunii]|uniref:CCHC-type domain-containing protein n=1 Tax=Chara braunii TaxID=69332 RepID=A0A388JTI6_CHABU|nr:hypothetical protein CBR_g19206 [Chara braunii]|eukprot:GBG61129.1 hypothetical protein CBR_g19206 [Chara braunii]